MEAGITTRGVVAVQLQDRKRPEQFGGKEYTYLTHIPLDVGDIVTAPTIRGDSKAKVTRINVAEDELVSGIEYKTIERKYEPPAPDDEAAEADSAVTV